MSNRNREQGYPPSHHDNDSDHVISNENTITNGTNGGVAISDDDDVTNLNITNDDVATSDNINVAISNSDTANYNSSTAIGNVATSNINNDITADSDMTNKEQEYHTIISNMKRTIEMLSIKEKQLLNDLAELKNKYKLLEDTTSHRIDSICSEREHYKMERDELQRKINNTTSVKLLPDSQQITNVPQPHTPSGDTWKPINHSDVKVRCSSE